MLVQALSYLVVRADDRDDWATYGTRLLGLQKVDQARASLAFRMDDRKQRLVVDSGGGKGIARAPRASRRRASASSAARGRWRASAPSPTSS